jgi:hypothetical protein
MPENVQTCDQHITTHCQRSALQAGDKLQTGVNEFWSGDRVSVKWREIGEAHVQQWTVVGL